MVTFMILTLTFLVLKDQNFKEQVYIFHKKYKTSQENCDCGVTLDVGNCNVDNALSSQMKTSAPSVTGNISILGTFQLQISENRERHGQYGEKRRQRIGQ